MKLTTHLHLADVREGTDSSGSVWCTKDKYFCL